MSEPLLLRDAEATLRELAASDPDPPLLHQFMRMWLTGAVLPPDLRQLVDAQDPLRSYQSIACVAFAEAAGVPVAIERLDEGLRWLQAVALDRGSTPAPVTTDAVALLALALACRQRQWLQSWHDRARTHAIDCIEPSWLRGSADLVRGAPGQAVGTEVRVALASKGVAHASSQDEEDVLRALVTGILPGDALHAFVTLVAVQWLRRSYPVVQRGRATVDDVVVLLQGVERALQEWTWEENARTRNGLPRQWHVDNEYHVQNLLWTILAPVFPDLRREEFRSQVGPVQPRIDLAIPSLRLIIEVKFARTVGALHSVLNEIAEDVSLYFVDTTIYDQLLVFVWDDSRHVEEHDTLVAGLVRLRPVSGAVVISRPGKMVPMPSVASAPSQTSP